MEKLIAEFCIKFILTLLLAQTPKMALKFSSAMNEKSLEEILNST